MQTEQYFFVNGQLLHTTTNILKYLVSWMKLQNLSKKNLMKVVNTCKKERVTNKLCNPSQIKDGKSKTN